MSWGRTDRSTGDRWRQTDAAVFATPHPTTNAVTRLCGDPHILTDGSPAMDFPAPTCSFVLTDGTLIVADAPAANQPLNDVHVFTDDAQYFPLGTSAAFDDVIGTVFLQKDDGSFYGVVSRSVGTANPNPVPKAYADVN